MRRIAVVTTGRADYGIYRPLLARLHDDPEIALLLVAAGMHLRPEFGMTVEDIDFPVAERLDFLAGGDTALDTALSMAEGTAAYGRMLDRLRPDILVVLGDRFEMHAAAVAAQPFDVAVAHIHGGELTLGAMDDALRHSISKLAHLHFPATEVYAGRIRQMGEEPWRVTMAGALSLDNLDDLAPMPAADLAAVLGLALEPAPVLVTYHPPTREAGDLEARAAALLQALDRAGLPVVVTAPNADAGGRRLRRILEDWTAGREDAVFVANLGTRAYFALMGRAAAMVGNSSSGIIEAASFRLPVVNVGSRQEGRLRPANVIDVGEDAAAILDGLHRATGPGFAPVLAGLDNPYRADRPAAAVIRDRLATVDLGPALLKKRFVDRAGPAE